MSHTAEIIEIIKPVQRKLGLDDDGVDGLITWKAIAKAVGVPPVIPVVPAEGLMHNDWPHEADAAAFFGYPPNLTQIEPPFPMRMNYDGAWHSITQITCNMKVAASLRRILAAILAHYGSAEAVKEAGMDVYDGCYNDRNVRGSSSKRSMHAYGAAIDINADHFPLGSNARWPEPVIAIFKAEGWRYGGDYQGRKDGMHAEACA